MIRWVLWLLAGALLGGIVHLLAVLILPRTATQDAYSRLNPITPVSLHRRCRSPPQAGGAADGSAFVAVCR